MPTPQQSRAELAELTGEAVGDAHELFAALDGPPEQIRSGLLVGLPGVIDYYSAGAGVLATDFYDESRAAAKVKQTFESEIVIGDRTVKIRRAVAWSTAPLFGSSTEADMAEAVRKRLAAVVQPEVANVYRGTILGQKDPQYAGWTRVTGVCCKFCRFLASRGAVYRESSARFAAHPNCDCSAQPVFFGGPAGPDASVDQYMASRRKNPQRRAALREALEAFDG